MTNYQMEFKSAIYEPYTQAWQIMKILKEADLTKQDIWDSYLEKCEDFRRRYCNEFGCSIYRVLLDAGDEAKRAWNGVQ